MTIGGDFSEDEIDRLLNPGAEVIDHPAEIALGIKTFLDAARFAGQDDPLDGPRTIIPDILAEGQTAIFAGAPGSGKSFAFLNLLATVARGALFLGRSTLQGGVIYVTGEGQGGLAKRISALAQKMELNGDSSFLYIKTMPRMLDPQSVSDFIAAVKILTAKWAVPIRVICLDTLNAGLIGGSENESKDMALLLHGDARIKAAFDCATIWAHHPGKAEGNDLRGHSSLLGNVDVIGLVKGRTGTRTIEIMKQKDGETGVIFGYSLIPVELGTHKQTGEPVMTCTVDWIDGETTKRVKASKAEWPKGIRQVREAITTALIDAGEDYRISGDGPTVRAVVFDQARQVHRKRYIGNGENPVKAEEKAWNRNIKRATDEGLIAGETIDGKKRIWLVNPKGQ
jgi:hypothetical protein